MALKWLRDQMKYLSWVLWTIVAAFIFALFFDFGSVNLNDPQNQVAATVGSEEITYAEFRTQYQSLESRYRQMFGEQWTPEMAERFNIPKQALDQLIDRRIRLMEAAEVGLEVTDQEVQDAILAFPAFQDEDGKFIGRERVQQILRANRLSDAQFAEDMREDLLVQKLSRVLASTLFISDQEVEDAYKETVEKAEIQFVELPAASLADSVTASTEDVESYFADNAGDYEKPEERIVDYILIDTVKIRREMEIPDEELLQYYNDHSDEFEQEEQVMARHILFRGGGDGDAATEAKAQAVKARIEGGEDFATLAREMSDDEGTAQRGGNLGFFKRGAMVKPFEEAAFGAAPGDLVGPVKTDFGYHLIEVMQRREGGVQDFEQVKPIVRSKVMNPRVDELAESKSKEIQSKIEEGSVTESDQLKALAEETGVTYEAGKTVARGQAVAGIGIVESFQNAVFNLKRGEVSDAVKVPRGWVIARLNEVKAPRIPELAEVEADVRRAVETELRKTAVLEKLADAKAQLAGGGDFQSLAESLELEIKNSGEFGASGNIAGLGRNPEVVTAALSMEPGEVSEPINSAQGAVLFEVLDRTRFDAEEFEKEKEATREGEVDRRLGQVLSSIVEQRRRELAPKYDARVVQDFGIQDET